MESGCSSGFPGPYKLCKNKLHFMVPENILVRKDRHKCYECQKNTWNRRANVKRQRNYEKGLTARGLVPVRGIYGPRGFSPPTKKKYKSKSTTKLGRLRLLKRRMNERRNASQVHPPTSGGGQSDDSLPRGG